MAKNVTIEKGAPDETEVALFDPVYAGFSFGPGNAGETIDFGSRGGFEPHVWIGPRNHPLLDRLLEERPDLIEGDGSAGPTKVFVCPECMREIPSLIGYKSHIRTHKTGVASEI